MRTVLQILTIDPVLLILQSSTIKALVQFYIAFGKRFDAPALYREAAKLLRKYGLYEEELSVIEAGMKAIPNSGRHYEDLLKRKRKALELIQKNK